MKKIIKVCVLFLVSILGALVFSIGLSCAEDMKSESVGNAVNEQPVALGDVKAQESQSQKPVELTGDKVEYSAEEGKFVASGNVLLRQNNATLFCDKLEFYRDRQEAQAIGNVMLTSDNGTVWADRGFYNFTTKKGEFVNARLMASPIFGRAETISKIRDNYYVLAKGYLTTSDYDDPEWRIKSRRIEVFPGDRAIARQSTMYLGGVPVMYFPKYVQYLNERPSVRVVPGYSKQFGAYLLTSYRTRPMDRVGTTYHLDYREKKDLAWGVDVEYSPKNMGQGLIKTYYTNERTIAEKHIWLEGTEPTVERERYFGEWRHKWDIDPQTNLILQYYKAKDANFRKEYFEREYRTDQNPPTFFLLTRSLPNATATLRTDFRVNPYEAAVERLPEFTYALSSQQVGDTGFYVKSTNSAVKLVKKEIKPSDIHHETVRLDTDNELSRPFKVAFLEFRPYVGTEQTYYSKTLDPAQDDAARGLFRTGSDISTKFYKIYDAQFKKYGIEVNRLRHVITPTISYQYQHNPTVPSSTLYGYDAVDSRGRGDSFSLGLENKLQTKRQGQSVDLLRSLLSVPFYLKDDPSKGGFGDVTWSNDLYPNKYVTLHSDMTYSNQGNNLQTANTDLYLNNQKNWDMGISRRWTYQDDDILTAQLSYKFNPKWRTVVYERWNIDKGEWQEQQYSLVRDLHSWEVELAWNEKQDYGTSGSEFWIIFRLKAFPDMKFDYGSNFHQRKPGSQTISD